GGADFDVVGHLVGGGDGATMGAQAFAIERYAVSRDNKSDNRLAALAGRRADHRRLGDAWTFQQYRFDLGRRHIDAGAFDHVAVTRGKMKAPGLVEEPQVAGAEIAVCGEDRFVMLGAGAAIAGRDIALDLDRADFAGR